MSGGSYNYLAHACDLEDLLAKRTELESMADRLAGLSEAEFPGAAAAERLTRSLLLRVQLWAAHADASTGLLAGVWKAVEWWDSADSGPDNVRGALAKMLDAGDPAPPFVLEPPEYEADR
jgi:hypothetical protein